jgi:hypothetical protein
MPRGKERRERKREREKERERSEQTKGDCDDVIVDLH